MDCVFKQAPAALVRPDDLQSLSEIPAMSTPRYNIFHSINQKIASSTVGAAIYSKTLHIFDRWILKLSGGRYSMTSLVAGLPLVLLTSTGAKSGQLRTSPLLCIRDEDDPNQFALIATNWGQARYPSWYFNLRANPRATCAVNRESNEYDAREATDHEYERFWQLASDTYVGYALYKERLTGRRIPIMVLQPVVSPTH
jgi:deazaflavin-dependent oxidoreductase (nitroreductase family)